MDNTKSPKHWTTDELESFIAKIVQREVAAAIEAERNRGVTVTVRKLIDVSNLQVPIQGLIQEILQELLQEAVQNTGSDLEE